MLPCCIYQCGMCEPCIQTVRLRTFKNPINSLPFVFASSLSSCLAIALNFVRQRKTVPTDYMLYARQMRFSKSKHTLANINIYSISKLCVSRFPKSSCKKETDTYHNVHLCVEKVYVQVKKMPLHKGKCILKLPYNGLKLRLDRSFMYIINKPKNEELCFSLCLCCFFVTSFNSFIHRVATANLMWNCRWCGPSFSFAFRMSILYQMKILNAVDCVRFSLQRMLHNITHIGDNNKNIIDKTHLVNLKIDSCHFGIFGPIQAIRKGSITFRRQLEQQHQ